MSATIKVTSRKQMPAQMGKWHFAPGVPVQVPVEFISQFGLDKSLEFDFSSVPEYLMSRNSAGELWVDFHCPLSMLDGYGRHAVWLIRGLRQAGIDVSVRETGMLDPEYLPSDIRALRNLSSVRLPSKIGVAFTLGYDHTIYGHPSPVKIAITQFETNRLPRVHVSNVNQCDHVLVTSSFGAKMFRSSGVMVPIDVMTPGIDTASFPFYEREPDGLFKVLILGGLTKRKNPLGAIRIFQRASEGNPDWRMTIKTRPASGIDEVQRVANRDTRISFVMGDDPPDAVVRYYQKHDCLLWPSYGEGVGLPPLEAMSTGMELVCSDNSGMSDYMGSHCYPIKTTRMESAEGPGLFTDKYVRAYGDVGDWWIPDENHAVSQLSKCFSNWREGKGRGRQASEYVHANHTLAHSARDIIKVVEKYAD